MPIKWYKDDRQADGYVKVDIDTRTLSFFFKEHDPVLAAELTQYEQSFGEVADVFVPPPLSTEQEQAVGFDVIMKYIVAEKQKELQWNSSKQYHIDDVVYHSFKMWKATSNNTNNEPDDVPGDWEVVS